MSQEPRRYRAFDFEGRRLHIVEDPTFRARDLERNELTLHDESRGTTFSLKPHELEMPTLAGLAPSGPLFELRPLLEEVLALGFDDTWVTEIVHCVRRHGLFAPAREGRA